VKIDFEELLQTAGLDFRAFDSFYAVAKINHFSDLARYLVLYCFGGVYLDFDIIVVKDLGPLLNDDFFVGSYRTIGFSVKNVENESVADAETVIMKLGETKPVYSGPAASQSLKMGAYSIEASASGYRTASIASPGWRFFAISIATKYHDFATSRTNFV